MQDCCCVRYDSVVPFQPAPECSNLVRPNLMILSVVGCLVDAVANVHNLIMVQEMSKWVKIPAIAFLATLMLPIFIVGVVDTVTRFVLSIITSPLLCTELAAAPLAIYATAMISCGNMVNSMWMMVNMFIADKKINAWKDGLDLAEHVKLENLLTLAIAVLVRR